MSVRSLIGSRIRTFDLYRHPICTDIGDWPWMTVNGAIALIIVIRYITSAICRSVCLSCCLLATSHKNYWLDLHHNFARDVSAKRNKKEFWKSFASESVSRNFLKDSSTSQDRAFSTIWFIFLQKKMIESSWKFMHIWTRKSLLNCGSHPNTDSQCGPWRKSLLGIAIPGSPKFSNPEIPGLSRTQSRDFGINKIVKTVFLVLFKVILCIYSFFDAFLSPQWGVEGAVVLGADMRSCERCSKADFRVSYICLCLGLAIIVDYVRLPVIVRLAQECNRPTFVWNTYRIIYTVNHKKRDILFLTITSANLNQFL